MLELGKKSKILHERLSLIINYSKISKLFVHGDHIMNTYRNVNKDKRGNTTKQKRL